MKNLILTLLTVFAFTFSFAQSNTAKEDAVKLKKNSVEVVDYLASELKLEDKEKAALSNAFAEYAHNIAKLNEKLDAKGSKMSDKEKSKMTFEKMAEFTKLRDKKIKDVLSDSQKEKYDKISKNFDPMTLTMSKKKKK
tara:strand:+ start:60 stop:473 length:414 start_codon:yes stop_codon:yes gene_type:complete